MKQEIEQIIKKNLPEKEDIENADYYIGFNDCISQINTSLIADEVLKVVMEKIEEL